jgi:hypothetical protein
LVCRYEGSWYEIPQIIGGRASLGTIAVPMTASADVGIYFNSAPPPARYEVIPAPRKGYVWSSGYIVGLVVVVLAVLAFFGFR